MPGEVFPRIIRARTTSFSGHRSLFFEDLLAEGLGEPFQTLLVGFFSTQHFQLSSCSAIPTA